MAAVRIVSIVFALLVGLASLLVSVCGGGFFVSFGFTAIRSALHPTGMQTGLAILPMLILAGAFAAVGGWLFWQCIRFIRREWSKRD